MVFGPFMLSRLVGKVVWSGESQTGFAAILTLKSFFMAMIPIMTRAGGDWAHPGLLLSFFMLGMCITVLDTHGRMLVAQVHGENCSLPLNVYNAMYGLGAAVAPFLAVALPTSAFALLAGVDFTTAAVVAAKRCLKGKPRHWKEKVRGLWRRTGPNVVAVQQPQPESAEAKKEEQPSVSGSTPAVSTQDAGKVRKHVPPRVMYTGLFFVFWGTVVETAMSHWAFTFAAQTLGQPTRVAALFTSAFYGTYTAMRLLLIPLSTHVLPSAMIQAGTALTFLGVVLFRVLTLHFQTRTAGLEGGEVNVLPFLICVVLVGAGTCPFCAMTLAAIRRHGELAPQEQGIYTSVCAAGCCLGAWLPGVVSLPTAEMGSALCMFLVMSSSFRDFPWVQPRERAVEAAHAA